MSKFKSALLILLLIFIPLYPKFPLVGVSGTFVSVRLEDLLILFAVLLYLLSALKNRQNIFRQPIPCAILIYWLIGIFATFSGIFLTKTAGINLGILHTARRFEYMSLYLLAYSWLKNSFQLSFITRTLIIVSLLIAIYGLGQQFLGFPVVSTSNSEFSKGLALSLGAGARINSTFAGHYDLAAFTVIPLLLILALLPFSQNKPLLLVIGGLIYWSMLLSASRITFVGSFFSASLLLIIIRKKLWIVPLICISLVGLLISPQLRGRYLELITTRFGAVFIPPVHAQSKAVDTIPDSLKAADIAEDRSLNIRLNAEWPRAYRSFFKNPFFGTGFSSIGLAVDNEYLRILAETGILGLFAFGLIFLRFFKTSLPYLKNYQPSVGSAFIVAVTCSVVSLLLDATFIDYFEASKIAMTVWLLLGLAEKAKTFPIHD
jgi:O-antigen ligase